MNGSKPTVVLITGASVGLGLAITHQLLHDERLHLVLTARASSISRFAEIGLFEGERLWLRELDVTSERQRWAVIDEIKRRLGGVDVLINNAGVTHRTVTEYATTKELDHQMSVNFASPMALCALVMPSMRERRRGRIIQVSSASGLVAMPTMGLYSASKFALEAATEALHFEARPFGIQVSLIVSGFIHSRAYEKSLVGPLSRHAITDEHDCYHPHFIYMDGLIDRMMKLTPATPESVAAKVVATMWDPHPPLRVLATWDALLLWWFKRFTPQFLYIWLTYNMLPGVRHWRGRPDDTTATTGEHPVILSTVCETPESTWCDTTCRPAHETSGLLDLRFAQVAREGAD